MDRIGQTWRIVLQNQLSWQRIVGLGLYWVWTIMLFYSVVPYAFATNMRDTLYSSQLFSMVGLVVTLLFVALAIRRGDSLVTNRLVIAGGTVAMFAGTVLTCFADQATLNGTLCLGFGSVLTGSGSAVILLCWFEIISWYGERLALVELAGSAMVAFALGLALAIVPTIVSCLLTCALPLVSAFFLLKNANMDEAREHAADEADDAARTSLSVSTRWLFARALVGVVLVGFVGGFFDVLSGYKTFEVQDIYGLWLLAGGLAISTILAVVAIVLNHDSAFYGYRFSILFVCLGCLLTPFLNENVNVGALIFGGYFGYGLVLCSICIGIATSYRIGVVKACGLGFVAIYGGELLGSLFAHGLNAPGVELPDLSLLTLIAVSLLFISHLFLFTETDLVTIGIGEMNLSSTQRKKIEALGGELPNENATANVPSDRTGCAVISAAADALTEQLMAQKQAADEAAAAAPDPCAAMSEQFGLSAREQDVLPLLLEGRTISRIQDTLFISAGTVSTHIRHIYQKTGAANRQELIDLAQHISEEL